jgi:hypothetical protein
VYREGLGGPICGRVLGVSARVLLLRRDTGLVALRGRDVTGCDVLGASEAVAAGWAVATLAMSAAISVIARLAGRVTVYAGAHRVVGEELAVGDGVVLLGQERTCFAVRLTEVSRVEGFFRH